MLQTAGLRAFARRALSAGFDGGLSPPFQFVAAQLLGGWGLTEAGLAPASPSGLLWTHRERVTPASSPPLVQRDSPDHGSHPWGRRSDAPGPPRVKGQSIRRRSMAG